MKRTILTLVLFIILSQTAIAQEKMTEFSKTLQNYYQKKDKKIFKHTLEVLNDDDLDFKRVKPMLTGFYAALFATDKEVKEEFKANTENFENLPVKVLMRDLTSMHVDSVFKKFPISPEKNDMYWAAFFATGDVKYLDQIVANTTMINERVDRNLYLTAGSAKWSLCSNAKDYKIVKTYIQGLSDKKLSEELLSNPPDFYKDEMIALLKEQKAKGLWISK